MEDDTCSMLVADPPDSVRTSALVECKLEATCRIRMPTSSSAPHSLPCSRPCGEERVGYRNDRMHSSDRKDGETVFVRLAMQRQGLPASSHQTGSRTLALLNAQSTDRSQH